MKRNREESQRWFNQSKYDLEAAKRNFEQKIYPYTCFLAEQAAQKALKSFLFLKGERYVWEHSVQKLIDRSSQYSNQFSALKEAGAILDKYYLTTRYPDAIAPPALPYESYTEKEASGALELSGGILDVVRNELEGEY